ncbi:MAG: divergent polysaccharide deacetylase family protein, partial [Nitrospinota bacterium]|nr:divergent polysaccharide deacetylase family protein [Nitrospinota bacterium]
VWAGVIRPEAVAAHFDENLERLFVERMGGVRRREFVPRTLGLSRWNQRRERIRVRDYSREAVLAALRREVEEAALRLRLEAGRPAESTYGAQSRDEITVSLGLPGARTHILSIEIAPVLLSSRKEALSSPAVPSQSKRKPVAAILIDDLGYDLAAARELIEIDLPLTFAILPHLTHSREIAQKALSRGREVLLHLPMEPADLGENDPGPGALFLRHGPDEWRRLTRSAIDAVPGITGINNHMGSRLTERPDAMEVILREAKSRGLYYVDSITSGRSVGFSVGRRLGLRVGKRTLFLDNEAGEEEIGFQVNRLIAQAKREGKALAIGHPHAGTIAAIRKALPRIRASGVKIVTARVLVEMQTAEANAGVIAPAGGKLVVRSGD